MLRYPVRNTGEGSIQLARIVTAGLGHVGPAATFAADLLGDKVNQQIREVLQEKLKILENSSGQNLINLSSSGWRLSLCLRKSRIGSVYAQGQDIGYSNG